MVQGRYLPSLTELLQILLTFGLTVIGWIIFRAESMAQAVDYLSSMVTNRFFDPSALYGKRYLLFGIMMLGVEWLQRTKQHALQFPEKGIFGIKAVRWMIYVLIYLALKTFTGHSQTFIYFQF